MIAGRGRIPAQHRLVEVKLGATPRGLIEVCVNRLLGPEEPRRRFVYADHLCTRSEWRKPAPHVRRVQDLMGKTECRGAAQAPCDDAVVPSAEGQSAGNREHG